VPTPPPTSAPGTWDKIGKALTSVQAIEGDAVIGSFMIPVVGPFLGIATMVGASVFNEFDSLNKTKTAASPNKGCGTTGSSRTATLCAFIDLNKYITPEIQNAIQNEKIGQLFSDYDGIVAEIRAVFEPFLASCPNCGEVTKLSDQHLGTAGAGSGDNAISKSSSYLCGHCPKAVQKNAGNALQAVILNLVGKTEDVHNEVLIMLGQTGLYQASKFMSLFYQSSLLLHIARYSFLFNEDPIVAKEAYDSLISTTATYNAQIASYYKAAMKKRLSYIQKPETNVPECIWDCQNPCVKAKGHDGFGNCCGGDKITMSYQDTYPDCATDFGNFESSIYDITHHSLTTIGKCYPGIPSPRTNTVPYLDAKPCPGAVAKIEQCRENHINDVSSTLTAYLKDYLLDMAVAWTRTINQLTPPGITKKSEVKADYGAVQVPNFHP